VRDFLSAVFTIMWRLGLYQGQVPPRMLATVTAAKAFADEAGGAAGAGAPSAAGMTLPQFKRWFGF
jgi:hypothetical protein